MANAKWATANSGSWYVAADWSPGAVPGSVAGSDDIATIDAPGSYTVSAGNTGATTIGSVNLNAPGATLSVSGGGLSVKTALTLNSGTLQLQGALQGGSLILDGGVVAPSYSLGLSSGSATLSGVRVQGTLDLGGGSSLGQLTLLNNTTFVAQDGTSPGTILLGGDILTFGDSTQLDNVSINSSNHSGFFSSTLNLGNASDAAGKVVALGKNAALNVSAGQSVTLGGKGTLANGGVINVAGSLTIGSLVSLAQASQPGTLTVQSGGTLSFGTAGSTTQLTGLAGAQVAGTLAIGGNITTAALTSGLAAAAITGQVAFSDVIDNSATGSVLEIKAGTPLATVGLNSGTVLGGTLRLTSSALRLNYSNNLVVNLNTLDRVRVLGDFTLTNGYNSSSPLGSPILGLKDGVTFAGLSGAGRGSLTATDAYAEIRALDAETLDHVNIQFSNSTSSSFGTYAQSLTTASGTTLALGADAALNVLSIVNLGGGGTLSYAGAVTVQSGGSLAVASGTTLAKASGGSLAVASGGTLSIGWVGAIAPLAGVAGATVNGTLALAGSLTSAAYTAALGSVTGTGRVSVGGTLDNTGAALSLAGNTVAGRLILSGTLKGGTVAAGASGLTLGYTAALDGVTLRGPTTLASNGPSTSALFRNGLALVGAGGSGPGSLTLASTSLQAADTETLDNAAVQLTNATLSAASGQRLTLGAGLALDVTGNSTLTNATSQGSITVEGNSALNVDGSFVSTGALNLKFGGKLNLSDTITTAGLTGLIASAAGAGAVGLNGTTLDNTGATLTLLATSRLNNLAASNVTLRGGTVVNAGGNIGFTSGTVLDGVTWQGAFAPTTTNASYEFKNGTVVQGVNGGRALIDLSAGNSNLTLSQPLDNTDLRMGSGSLSMSQGGPVVLGAGTNLTISGYSSHYGGLSNAGKVTQAGSVSYTALTNTGTIAISKGTTSATTLANSGLISLNAATLAIGAPTVLGGTVAFMDPTAKLVFQGSGAVGATLQNFQNGDSVDIQGLSYNGSLSVSVQGDAVQVNQGSVLVGSFHLSGGSYSADQFSLAADNSGGTLLRTTHRLSAPVFSGPGKDFNPAYYLANNPDIAAAGVDPLQHYLSNGWKEGRNPNAYFNTNWYLNQNPDIRAAGLNPLQHYEDNGWKEGRDPGPNFSVSAYLAANPDVKAAGIDPLQHFLVNGQAEGRAASTTTPHAVGAQDALVDRTWYLAQHPDVAASGEDASANYHRVGWTLGYNPDQWFDTTYYLKANPDVAAAKVDPLAQFEASGYREGRDPSLAFSDSSYLANNPDVAAAGLDPLAHYMSYGRFEGRMALTTGPQATGTPDPLVDRAFYYAQFATIVPASADATASYNQAGWQKGLSPDPYFDTNYYLAHNADVRAAGLNPLAHYEAYGWKEGRDPSAAFSANKYLAAYSDVRSSGTDPLASFITTGQAQGRIAFAV